MRQRHARCFLHLFERHIRLTIGDVVAYGVVEQNRFLRDVANQPAQRVDLQVAHVLAIHQQLAAGDIEEARDEVDQRGLAGAAGTDEGDYLAARHCEIDAGENFLLPLVRCIGKAHVFEADFVAEAFHRFRVRPVSHRVLLVHELEDVAGGAQSLLEVVVEESKLAHRIVELEDRHDEGKEGACGQRSVVDLLAAEQEQHRDSDGADDIHQRRADGLRAHRAADSPGRAAALPP